MPKNPIKDYAFSDCIQGIYRKAGKWITPKDMAYDLNDLPRTDQVLLAAYIGFLQDAGWNQANTNVVRLTADYEEQVDFFKERGYLKCGLDFDIHEWGRDCQEKQRVISVYNPIMCHFFRNPFSFPVERETKKYLVAGAVTNAALRMRSPTIKTEDKRIMSYTQYADVAEQLRAFSDLNKLHYSPWGYRKIVKNGKTTEKYLNSTWFYKPKELKKAGFLIPSFEIDNEVYRMPNRSDSILSEQLNFSRPKSYEHLEYAGLLDPPIPSKEILVGEIESSQTLLERERIHPTYAAEIRKNCEKLLRELEAPKEKRKSKKGMRDHFKNELWNNMRTGMTL